MIEVKQHHKSVIVRALNEVDSHGAGMISKSTLTRRKNDKGEEFLWIKTVSSAVMPKKKKDEWAKIVRTAARTIWPGIGVAWEKPEEPPSTMPTEEQSAREKEQVATAVTKRLVAGAVVAFVDEAGRKWESGWFAVTGRLSCDVCGVGGVTLWRNQDDGSFACDRHLTYR